MAYYIIPPGLIALAAARLGVTQDQVNAIINARADDGTLQTMSDLLAGQQIIKAEQFAIDNGLTTQQAIELASVLGVAFNIRIYEAAG